MQMRPASTAMPDETPSSVGRSEVSTDISAQKKAKHQPWVRRHILTSDLPTLRAEDALGRLRIGDGVVAVRTLAQGVVLHLHAQRVRIAVRARLVVEALFAQFFRCKRERNMVSVWVIAFFLVLILTLGAALGQANRDRIVALARALAGGWLADDVVQPGRTRLLARRSDVHAFGCERCLHGTRDT